MTESSGETEATQSESVDNGLETAPRSGILGAVQRHKFFSGVALLLIFVGVAAAWTQLRPLIAPEFRNISYEAPNAPQLVASPDETLYRIDPSQSEATYEVDETFAGSEPTRTRGTTNGIAGDFAINAKSPENS